ncbi:uncharacterized protein [Fopius arisanus]|uniref:RRM domain-containing protein n=1 Tax=Fopius arisanus TaxID=64838 RepID=A0A9R1SYL0_9HYME|nr:PREDICTED: uncharacterized protein LOC105264380 [Fopius arisanus]
MSSERSSPRTPKNKWNESQERPKYYIFDAKSDTWKVYFANNAALSISKIEAFFSKYGEIVKVQQNSPRDFCFIHFKREEDVKTCAFGMRNNSTIRLRPFRSTPSRQGKHDSFDSKSSPDKEERNGKTGNDLKDGQRSGVEIHRGKKILPNSLSSDAQSTPSSSYELSSNSISASIESIPLDPTRSSAEKKAPADDLPELIQKISIGSSNLGPLRTYGTRHPPTTEHITLQDVVVANIHESCEIDFILEMLEAFHPVCASKMKTIPEHSLRYCHVYFETSDQTQEVERIYDNAELFGKTLIVQRPGTLAANAERLS